MREHILQSHIGTDGNEYGSHSWCGLLVRARRPNISPDDYQDRVAKNVTGNVCQNCIAALEKGTPRVAH